MEMSEKKRRKKEFLDSFEARVEQINQDLKGEIKLKTLDDFLDEIRTDSLTHNSQLTNS